MLNCCYCVQRRRTHTDRVVFTEITLEGFMDHSQGDRSWCHAIWGVGCRFGLADWLCGTNSLDLMCKCFLGRLGRLGETVTLASNGGRSPCGSAYFVSPDAIFGQRVAEKLKRWYYLSEAFIRKWSYRPGRYIPKDKSPKVRQIWKIDASPSLFYQKISIHSFHSNI